MDNSILKKKELNESSNEKKLVFMDVTQKFCAGNICGDPTTGSAFYTAFRHVSDIYDTTTNDQLNEIVKDYVRKKKENKRYRMKYSEKWQVDAACEALAKKYGKIICLVLKKKIGKNRSDVKICFYGEKMSLDKQCVYIFHDLTKMHFAPLYVTQKENPTKKIINFTHNDRMKGLLRRYIRDDLKCTDIVNLDIPDDNDANEESIPTDGSSDSEDLSSVIDADDDKNSPYQQELPYQHEHLPLSRNVTDTVGSTSNKNVSGMQTKHSMNKIHHISYYATEIQHQYIIMEELSRVMEDIRRSGNQSSGTMVNNISEVTHGFRCKSVPRDGSCFFWALKYLLHFLKNISTKDLREITAYFIEKDETLCVIAPRSINNCGGIKDYSSRLRKGLYAGEPELVATAAWCQKQIIVLVMNNEDDKSFVLCIPPYSDEKLSECIYLQLNESTKHFEPLYIVNTKNPKEKIKVFPCNNLTVQNLLGAYITKKRQSLKKTDMISNTNSQNLLNKRKNSNENGFRSISDLKRSKTDPYPDISVFPVKSKAATPSYYLVENTNRLFLVISFNEEYLLNNIENSLEIRIKQVVQGDMNARPFYQFQVQSNDDYPSYCNPIWVDLKNECNQIKLLLTDSSQKNHGLIEFNQSLQFFLSPSDNGLVITEKITNSGALNDASHLHGLSFEVTLWSKKLGDKLLPNNNGIQYINQISIESELSFMITQSDIFYSC